MATQLSTLAKLHGPKSLSSCGQNKPIKRSKVRHCSEKDAGHDHYRIECTELHGDTAFGEKKCQSWRRRGRDPPRLLGLWYLGSSIKYILMKAKAFYNEFCCDAFEDSLVVKNDGAVSLVDPYFSIPVTPPPSVSP
ncbi:uncharacterized protein LOC104443287 [Eucalyptus grandis]|uniref:uncharacterized protein LOC104443287 n=1 Tax=Eucalyptus grandis TaxID=71139 RepID=UPI00192F0D1D|nr:uncharacterized protein LOC104443287 [Eucalyptus grandis]